VIEFGPLATSKNVALYQAVVVKNCTPAARKYGLMRVSKPQLLNPDVFTQNGLRTSKNSLDSKFVHFY
jgi:hypothetical protein